MPGAAHVSNPPVEAATGLRRAVFRALGTQCELQLPAGHPAADRFIRAAQAWVEEFEARYSRFRPASLVSRINAAAGGWVDIDAEMEGMLDVCAATFQLSHGILDATSGPLIRLWDYRHTRAGLPAAGRISEARALVGWNSVERRRGAVRLPHPGMSLDFGGWGKEWAVDAVAELAHQHGIADVLIDFGHDIRGLGRPRGRIAWHVGIEDSQNPGTHRGSIALAPGKGIASSGDYLRHFTHGGRRYGHIIDPRTGWPTANGVTQVTVVADTCFQAGLISTTAFILGPVAGREFIERFPGAEGLIVSAEGRVQTKGFWNHVVA